MDYFYYLFNSHQLLIFGHSRRVLVVENTSLDAIIGLTRIWHLRNHTSVSLPLTNVLCHTLWKKNWENPQAASLNNPSEYFGYFVNCSWYNKQYVFQIMNKYVQWSYVPKATFFESFIKHICSWRVRTYKIKNLIHEKFCVDLPEKWRE